jgi:hypothetical protein
MSLRRIIYNGSYNHDSRGVAQPGSAPALGAGGPRFKSARPDQTSNINSKARPTQRRVPSGGSVRPPITKVAPAPVHTPSPTDGNLVEFDTRPYLRSHDPQEPWRGILMTGTEETLTLGCNKSVNIVSTKHGTPEYSFESELDITADLRWTVTLDG